MWATYAMEVKMAWICCKAHTCDEGAHCISDMTLIMWLRWRRSRHDLAWWTSCKHEGQVGGFGPIDRMAVKLKQDLAPMNEGNDEKQVRSRSMNQQGHVMIWSGSYHLWYGWCMCCINIEGDGMECTRQRYNLGHFISPVIGESRSLWPGLG